MGEAGSGAPPQGPQIAISIAICSDLKNRINNRLLFCQQYVYCSAVNCGYFHVIQKIKQKNK